MLLQQDNLRGQNTLEIKKISFANDVFIWNTIENCTDAVAWQDQWPLWDLKCGIDKEFWDDYESSPERTAFYSNPVVDGGITAAQWRISITHWTMIAWNKTKQKSKQLLKSAQRVGFANCRCECENHLIKVGKIHTYKVGKKTDPVLKELTDEDAQILADESKAHRARLRRQHRAKISAGLALAHRLKKQRKE